MVDSAIKVSGLSKAYRIGLKDQKHDTLGAALRSWLYTPIRNLKSLGNLSDIRENDTDKDIFWALRDIDFEVHQGEVLGIIGKNGAGKSTLLKILSRIAEPSSGKVEIYGRVASLLEVGTGFNGELTGRENVYLNGAILGMTRREIDRKFDEIVDFSGVEKFIDTPVKRFSSGMKVRLAFAVAAHLDPEILIIDEVLAVGDAEFQKKCLGKMKNISEGEGKTVLFVSHDMSAISALSQSILLLDNGRITFNGDKDTAINLYLCDTSNSAKDIIFENDTFSITGFKIRSAQGSDLELVQIFQTLSFVVSLTSKVVLSKFRMEVILRNNYGVIIANFSTVLSQQSFELAVGENVLVCSVPCFNLAPEIYTVDIHIFPSILSDKVLKIPGVGTLTVINSEMSGIKQKFRSDWYGYVVLEHKWTKA